MSVRHFLRLLRYVAPHRRDLAIALLAMAVGIALEVLKPWPTKILLDQVLADQPPAGVLGRLLALLPGTDSRAGLLAWVSGGTLLIFLASSLASMVSTIVSVRYGQRMVYDLAGDLFLHLQRLSLLFHGRRSVGDTIKRVTADPYCVQSLVNDALLPLLQSVVMLLAMFGVMWAMAPALTLLSLTVAPLLVLSIRVFGEPMKRRMRERLDLEGKLVASVHQALTALPAVQAFAREEMEHERFRQYAGATVTAYERSIAADMWFKLVVGLVTAGGTAGIMYLGGRSALTGEVSAGTIIVFLSYLTSLYVPLNAMTYTASILQHAAANADRVLEVLDTPPDVQERPGARDAPLVGAVRYEEVTFGYDPGRPVLDRVSFDVRPGEVVAIVGATGAGKTTLVNLLPRLFDPWSGRITIDGLDVRDLRLRSLRRQISIVLQEPFIFPVSIAENIAYGRPDATPEAIAAAAAAANAAAFIERLPHGYETVVGDRGMTLSGGEKQRLSIARAFVKDAPILILDEPTSALDARTEALLLEALARLVRGRTTFIIAHRLSTIRRADRILVLKDGHIAEQGSHEELLERGGAYAALHRAQFGPVREPAER